MVWVNALVRAIDGDVEAERDVVKADVMRIALRIRITLVFFMLTFHQI